MMAYRMKRRFVIWFIYIFGVYFFSLFVLFQIIDVEIRTSSVKFIMKWANARSCDRKEGTGQDNLYELFYM